LLVGSAEHSELNQPLPALSLQKQIASANRWIEWQNAEYFSPGRQRAMEIGKKTRG
jgi:hypothetical protein